MEILHSFNDRTKLGQEEDRLYILKAMTPEDLPLYEALQELENTHIVTVYKPILLDGQFYAVQDYVPGTSLATYLEKNGALSPEETRLWMLELCDGLSAIHGKGIIHRDINPNNIIVMDDGHLKVIDFGISRLQKKNSSTDTQILGTHGYAAPEQYGFRQSTPRTDIYALGVLMNYMLTLKMPNEQLANGPLKPMIQCCTEIDEDNRYASAVALAAALESGADSKAFYRKIPGFRSGMFWKGAVAVLYYLGAGLVTFACASAGKNPYQIVCYFLAVFIPLYGSVPILFDMGNWMEKWSFTRGKSTKNKHIAQAMLLILCLFLFFVFIIIS